MYPSLPDHAGGVRSRAYTDLLLHDMGADLDDGVGEPGVASAEWRTAPLIAHGRRRRAAAICMTAARPTLDAAIRAHGGEATRRVCALRAAERDRAAGAVDLRGEPVRLRFALALLAALCSLPRRRSATSGEGTPIVRRDRGRLCARRRAARSIDYIVPAYAGSCDARQRAGLTASSRTFATSPTTRPATRLAAAFADTIRAWAGVDFLRFGPMAQEGRYERFAFLPDVHGTGARQIRRFLASEDEALLEPGALAGQSAAVQGLPALESLLYSGDERAAQGRRARSHSAADSAAAVAGNMRRSPPRRFSAGQGESGWAELIEEPGPENPVYRTHAEAMTEILKAILTGLEQVRDHRLLPALGETPEEAKASRAPYNASGPGAPLHRRVRRTRLQRFVETSGILGLVPEQQAMDYANSVGFEFANLKRASRPPAPTSKRRSPIPRSARSSPMRRSCSPACATSSRTARAGAGTHRRLQFARW